MILSALALVPRLSHRFRIQVDVPHYVAAISDDTEFKALQTSIQAELRANQRKLYAYMSGWTPFAPLWQFERGLFMKHYREIGETTAADFDANVRAFTEVSTQLALQEVTKTINFVSINARRLRRSILIEIEEWQRSYLALMTDMTTERMRSFFEYTVAAGETIGEVPQNVDDLKRCSAFYDKTVGELDRWEKILHELEMDFEVLRKHDVRIDAPLQAMELKLGEQWNGHLMKIKEAAEVLDSARDNFKLML